jgi:tetratricopeptide (TPR) repeat protein
MELRERVLAIVKMLQIATILDVKSDSQRLENQLNEILSKRLGDDHLAIALFLLLDSPNATEEWRFRSEQAIKIIERIQPDGTKFRDTFRQLEASLFPLANRLQSARRFDETRLILSRVAQLARTLGDPFKEAVYQNNTAFTFTLEERWQDGLEGFMRAAQLFKEVGNDIETFVAENNWAACLVELGDLERAEPILQRSIAPLAEKGDARERKAHVYLAKIIEARGEIQEAINHLRRAVEIGKLVNPMYLDVDKLHLARLVSISDNGHPS